MKLYSISSVKDEACGYTFLAMLYEGSEEWRVSMTAHILLDYRLFQERILECTGRLYHCEANMSWLKKIDDYLDNGRKEAMSQKSGDLRPSVCHRQARQSSCEDDYSHQIVS